MSLVNGPFDIKWGANTLIDISEIALDYSVDSSEHKTIDNRVYIVDGAQKASVKLTLLASDVAALAVVLPQYHVLNGRTMSSGERVNEANGAIDIVTANCDQSTVYNDLDITSCGNPGQTFRLKNARTRIDSMNFADNAIRTITVQFLGEPASGVANVQFFKEGTISVVS